MIAARGLAIAPFMVMEVLEAAQALERSGRDIVHLEIGEPDFETPAVIREAAERALREGHTHYTHSMGRRDLREAIAESYGGYGVTVDPDSIVVTAGTSPALWMTLAAIVDPGDEVILGDPSYACYPNFIRFFGGVPRYVALDDRYQFPLDAVRDAISPRTKAILINAPSNPTGTMLDDATMADLADLGVPVISDEIYHGLVYEGRERSMREFAANAIVLNGFSKAYAMTGWRLGYVILPPDLVRPVQNMAQNFFISASDFVQVAGIAALRHAKPDVARMRAEYDLRRRRLIDGLRSVGFGIATEPTGAFYILADARRWDSSAERFCYRLLHEAGVATAPGSDFGPAGEGHIRFCYAASIDRIDAAIHRLRTLLT